VFTVYQRGTSGTAPEADSDTALLKIRFPNPVGDEQIGETSVDSIYPFSPAEVAEVLSIVMDRHEGAEKEQLESARLGLLHEHVKDECARATVEDFEEAYSARILDNRVSAHVWDEIERNKINIHYDDVNRLIYALCQPQLVDLEDLKRMDIKDLLLSARKDAAPAPATVEAAALPEVW
jgi:hypothetical protein